MQEIYFEEKIIRNKKIQSFTAEQYKFVDCEFKNCFFEECKIIGCIFVNCKFENCTVISLDSKYSELKNAVFIKCNLIGVHWNTLLPSGKYAHPMDKLENCFLKYNTFLEMNFIKFSFSGNTIQESMFEECNLSESNFHNCRLEGTQIFKCDIRRADFTEAKGYAIDIKSNKLKQAKFSFPDVVSLLETLEIKIV